MAAAAAGATDRCPRCGGAFACGAAGPAPCPCTGVVLAPALLAGLRAHFAGCLCLDCLRALAAGAPLDPGVPPGPEATGRGARTG